MRLRWSSSEFGLASYSTRRSRKRWDRENSLSIDILTAAGESYHEELLSDGSTSSPEAHRKIQSELATARCSARETAPNLFAPLIRGKSGYATRVSSKPHRFFLEEDIKWVTAAFLSPDLLRRDAHGVCSGCSLYSHCMGDRRDVFVRKRPRPGRQSPESSASETDRSGG